MPSPDIQREEIRNRLLRRADWRFLLPNPKPAQSICFASGLLARAVEQISERTIELGFPTSQLGECDLAVLSNPTRAQLAAAWDALGPGGTCYSEWKPPRAMGSKGVRRRLEAAGFVDITCYWAWPPPFRASSLFWLPLDRPGVLRYFLATRAKEPGFVRQVTKVVLRTVWRYSLRLGITAPICATARKPLLPSVDSPQSPVADTSLARLVQGGNGDLATLMRAKWTRWGLGPKPDTVSMLLLTGGPRTVSKAVGLVFADHDDRPRVAVKLPRTPESVAGLENEAKALNLVRNAPPNLRGIPKVLFVRENQGLVTLGETALPGGVPLWRMLSRRTFRDLAQKGTIWLIELAGRPNPRPVVEWWGRLIEPMLADFEASFGPAVGGGVVSQIRTMLATLESLPLVCEQRDFSPWNVFIDAEGQLLVFDWESSEPRGLPATDLIYFLSYLAFFIDGVMDSHHFLDSYRAALTPSTFTGRVVAECMRGYAAGIGLDPNVLQPLRLVVWLRCSAFEYQHLMADAGGPPNSEALRTSTFLTLMMEELGRVADREAGSAGVVRAGGH